LCQCAPTSHSVSSVCTSNRGHLHQLAVRRNPVSRVRPPAPPIDKYRSSLIQLTSTLICQQKYVLSSAQIISCGSPPLGLLACYQLWLFGHHLLLPFQLRQGPWAEVTLPHLPLVVLLREHRANKTDHRLLVGEDPQHIGPPLRLLVEPLQWVARAAPGTSKSAAARVPLRRAVPPAWDIRCGRVQYGCAGGRSCAPRPCCGTSA
jgi:hypothetical protein